MHQLPRAQGDVDGAERAAARRALRVLQHRLRPRLRAQRRALLLAGTDDAAAARRRLLPERPDVDAACRRCRSLLQPGERRIVAVELPAGTHIASARCIPATHTDIDHTGGAFPGVRITATGVEALPAGRRRARSTFVNDAGFEVAALVEDRTLDRGRADRARSDLAAGVSRHVRRSDPAAGRRGGGRAGGAAVQRLARLDGALREGRRFDGLQHRARALRVPGLDRARSRRRSRQDDRRRGHGLVRRSRRCGEGRDRHAARASSSTRRTRAIATCRSSSAFMPAAASW